MPVPDVSCKPIAAVPGSVIGIPDVDLALGIIGAVGALVAGISILVVAVEAAALAAPVSPIFLVLAALGLIIGCLMAINALQKLRDYLFGSKLACLDGDRCTIARVLKIENNPDGDLTLNLLLAPADETTPAASYPTFQQAASLLFDDPGVATRGWAFRPELAGDVFGLNRLPIFHCEIEGTFMNDWLLALIAWLWVLIAFAAAAMVLAATIAALMATLVGAAVAILIALILFFLAAYFSRSTSEMPSAGAGPIESSTPGPDGAIHVDASGETISVGDFIAISGQHITDTGHHDTGCWNELHPVKAITKVTAAIYGSVSPDAPATGGDVVRRFCDALATFVDRNGTPQVGAVEHPNVR